MVIEVPREIHSSDDVLRGYIQYVNAGGGIEEFGREMIIDPERPETDSPSVITFGVDEERIAQRGLWRHLGVIYRGIQKRAPNSSAIAKVTMDTLHLADELRDDANQSVGILNRAFDYDQEVWLPEKARRDPDISQVFAQTMLNVRKECPVDQSAQLDFARRSHIFRNHFLRNEITSLALDLPRNRAHPALVKLAEAVVNYHEE